MDANYILEMLAENEDWDMIDLGDKGIFLGPYDVIEEILHSDDYLPVDEQLKELLRRG